MEAAISQSHIEKPPRVAGRLIPAGADSLGGIEITFFVPCFNEETRIQGTLETIQEAMRTIHRSFEIIVVDDGCTDGTMSVVRSFSEKYPEMNIREHKNHKNLGLARSFVDAAFLGNGRYFRLVCGDNVEPVETMIRVLEKIGEADMILPYYPELPGKNASRLIVSKLFTFLVDLISGYQIKYYNGCGLYRRYDVMRWAPYNYGFGFQADLITTLLEEGASYKEIPVVGIHFNKGLKKSPLTLRNFLSTGYTLFRIAVRRLRALIYGSPLIS